MTMLTFTVPPEYGYVILSVVITTFIQLYLGELVALSRKKHGVLYPTMYDNSKPLFNCIQRGHQNMLETHYVAITFATFSGFKFPILSAICLLGYGVGRIFYARGYATGDPNKRQQGAFNLLFLLGLLILNIIQGLSLAGFFGI